MPRGVHLHGKQVIGLNPGSTTSRAPHAVQQQAGADQQHQGERNFSNHEQRGG